MEENQIRKKTKRGTNEEIGRPQKAIVKNEKSWIKHAEKRGRSKMEGVTVGSKNSQAQVVQGYQKNSCHHRQINRVKNKIKGREIYGREDVEADEKEILRRREAWGNFPFILERAEVEGEENGQVFVCE